VRAERRDAEGVRGREVAAGVVQPVGGRTQPRAEGAEAPRASESGGVQRGFFVFGRGFQSSLKDHSLKILL
jgi:hypothetical protein